MSDSEGRLPAGTDDIVSVRAWALRLACAADIRLRGMDVAQAADEFAQFVLHGKLPDRLTIPSAPRKSMFSRGWMVMDESQSTWRAMEASCEHDFGIATQFCVKCGIGEADFRDTRPRTDIKIVLDWVREVVGRQHPIAKSRG
jgi:hypothetical protein